MLVIKSAINQNLSLSLSLSVYVYDIPCTKIIYSAEGDAKANCDSIVICLLKQIVTVWYYGQMDES